MQKLGCRVKANEVFKTSKENVLDEKQEGTPEGPRLQGTSVAFKEWVGCPDPSGPEEPVSQLPFLSTAPWARRAFVSGCVACPPAASVCPSHAPLFPEKPALSQSEKKNPLLPD